MYRFVFLATAVLSLAACERALEPADDADLTPCEVSVVATVPTDGSLGAYHRAPVEFHLDAPDPTATVVADFAGEQWVSEDGLIVSFWPTEPLLPESVHSVALDYCTGTPEITFTTSELGLPLEQGVDLIERAYLVDLTEARFLAGEGLEDIAASLVSPRLLLGIVEADDGGLALRAAVTDPRSPDTQDFCTRTVDLPAADFSESPFFAFESSEVIFGASAGTLALQQLSLSGTVAADGTWMGGGSFVAVIDARDVVDVLGALDGEAVCDFGGRLGLPCHACPGDGAEMCATLEVDQIRGEWIEGAQVHEILEADTDPRCGGSIPG